MSEQDLVKTLITYGAVVLGFCLGQASEWVKSSKASSRKKKSLRKLISLEVENNVFEVKSYWDKLINNYESWDAKDGSFRFVQLAEAVSKNPFPFLSSDAWKANLSEISSVYEANELNQLWKFQRNLERLSALYLFFSEARDEKEVTNRFHDASHGVGIGNIISMYGFADSVRDHAPEFKRLIEEIIDFKCNA
jgi:hypothetical protein